MPRLLATVTALLAVFTGALAPTATGTAWSSSPGAVGVASTGTPPESIPPTEHTRARVVHVVEGDTVDVRYGGHKVRVRILGIDSPEVHGGAECGGPEASAYTSNLLPRGTRVTLISDPTQSLTERDGRSLRYLKKGAVDVGRRIIRRGWALTHLEDDAEPFKRLKTYKAAQRHAFNDQIGLWGTCIFPPR